MVEIKRCDWAENSELERNYHDHEWGRPVHDEHKLHIYLGWVATLTL